METKKPNITSEELFDLASSEIDREVTFPQEMMEGLRVKYENQKDEYAEGNKEVQQLLEAGVVQDAARITKAEEFKKSISSDIDPSVLGNNLEAKFGQPFMLDIANIINGNNEVVYDGNMPGYEFEDGFNSMDKIQKKVRSAAIDKESKNMIQATISDLVDKAGKIQEGEDATFNYQKHYDNIYNKIIVPGNKTSLSVDQHFGKRVFEEDLLKSIKMGTYKDLGVSLTQEKVNELDPNTDNDNSKISEEDAMAIKDAIYADEDLHNKYLAEYYTNAAMQTYNANLKPEIKENIKQKEAAKKQAQVTPTGLMSRPQGNLSNIITNAGVINNGRFTLNKK